MIHSKKVNLVIIVALLGFLLVSYILERNRIVDKLAYLPEHYFDFFYVYNYDYVFDRADYLYKYGLFHNCPEDEQEHIIQNTREFLDTGVITQDDYDNLMKIYNGGFLLSDYLKDHNYGDYLNFTKFIGTHDTSISYWENGEYHEISTSVYENGKPYWKNGEIYIITDGNEDGYYTYEFDLCR